MYHPLACLCQAVQGHISGSGTASRVLCYCKDCQAFARFLNAGETVLDAQGGTRIVQIASNRVTISQGHEHIALMRLSERGLFRWYTRCCQTPIGNTLPTQALAFIGLIDAFMDKSRLAEDFPQRLAVVHTESALGSPKPHSHGLLSTMWRFAKMVVPARLTGTHTHSPFFDKQGKPVASPQILTKAQRKALKYPAQNAG